LPNSSIQQAYAAELFREEYQALGVSSVKASATLLYY